MYSISKSFAILTLLVGIATTPALAFSPGGAKISGKVTQNVDAKNVITVAAGYKAKAATSVAAVHSGSEVGGEVNQTVKAKNIITVAAGYQTQACTSLATIGDSAACR